MIMAAALMLAVAQPWEAGPAQSQPAPLSFFAPSVELSPDDRERIRSGRVFADTVDSSGRELAVFAAGTLEVTPESFVSRVQDIVALRKSRFVPAIGRFSNPPTLADLAGLTLADDDVDALVRCQPGNCDLKLGDGEIRRLHAVLAQAPSNRRVTAVRVFREILLERARAYLAGGLDALPPYHDKDRPLDPAAEFDGLLENSAYLARVPWFRKLLVEAHRSTIPSTSFLYWSVEDFGRKPVIRVTHVVIVRPTTPDLPEVLVGSIQVYASHYIDTALAVTTLERPVGNPAHLGYLYRARIDVLTNFLARWIVRGRIRDEVETVFTLQLRRLEAGR